MTTDKYAPGRLLHYRGRTWVVQPPYHEQLLYIKPLGGSEYEATALLRHSKIEGEGYDEATFPAPTLEHLDDFRTARLLFDASRLAFRNAAGAFRCMGKLSFRPRSYQVVPLVMALKQPVTRLLIADDVGVGKTVEALMILKELMERGDIQRFAVVCPPHLCEQWQSELKDKLDIEAQIIRSSTAAAIDRSLPDDRSAFYHLPYQVISIDYLKTDKRKAVFLTDCPPLVIVDEAHTCARPAGARSASQQQRYHLLHDLARNLQQHLLLLTATPHSGKNEEFVSLLGLLNPDFEHLQLEHIDGPTRLRIADYFIQRKRENIKRWLHEETPFPERESREIDYTLSDEYSLLFDQTRHIARRIQARAENSRQRAHFWAALALLRGVMSSPAAGIEMLRNRLQQIAPQEADDTLPEPEMSAVERLDNESDFVEAELLDRIPALSDDATDLLQLKTSLEALLFSPQDTKLAACAKVLKQWLEEDFQPIVFCRYINTAKYVAEGLARALPHYVQVQAITSELADEQRREKIQLLGQHPRRVLVATDCLSEGINLQEHFNAVLHYDLPWNPNRLEQRDGRVDRFGQTAPLIKNYLLWGSDNPMDQIVLRVLLRKVREIQRSTGVSVSLGEENLSVMDAILQEVLDARRPTPRQMKIDFGPELERMEARFSRELESIKEKAQNLRSVFAHESIKHHDIEAELQAVDEAIGDVQTVENFVRGAVALFGATIQPKGPHFTLFPQNLPEALREMLPTRNPQQGLPISFVSPTPQGFYYVGRNHRFTEQLCLHLLNRAFYPQPGQARPARAAVVRTQQVPQRTLLLQLRIRNIVREKGTRRDLIAEEMYLWALPNLDPQQAMPYTEAKQLLLHATSHSQIPLPVQQHELHEVLALLPQLQASLDALALQRAEELVKAHGRFRKLVGGRQYEAATPVLPPEVLGIYLLLPVPRLLV